MELPGLDRWITGNYGEDQYKDECTYVDCEEWDSCPYGHTISDCEEDAYYEELERKYDPADGEEF